MDYEYNFISGEILLQLIFKVLSSLYDCPLLVIHFRHPFINIYIIFIFNVFFFYE